SNLMHLLNWQALGRGTAALLVLCLAQILAGHGQAADYKVGSLDITQPWARATPKGASTGAAYMTVTNTGTKPERLSCVSSEAAAKCQIHVMLMQDGVMKMRPVVGGLLVKPGETITLKPSGFHVMLVDLKLPLQQGKAVAATLKVDTGATVQVEFPIAAIGASAPGVSAGGEMNMQGPGMMQMNKR
ncbi:MAG: copper chaperone PCu(A)C, partial [Pseudomonadota bacterium]